MGTIEKRKSIKMIFLMLLHFTVTVIVVEKAFIALPNTILTTIILFPKGIASLEN